MLKNDGKVKFIGRTVGSQKNNVSFDYDAFGRRTAKHVLTSSNDLLSSTYYTLDAQGNVMTTYEMNIDTVNSSLSFYQAEKYIYGSSRLGMLKDSVNVLGSAFTDTDSINITHTLGNKRYELSNHLGNVLTVITDKPIPHNNGGTVDYWQASIASAYDYSPFGVMLTGRTFEGKQTICHDSTTSTTQKPLEEGFSSWGSWTTMGNGLVTYVSGEMQVSNPNSSKKDIGASKAFTTGTGVHNVSFKVIGNTCATVVIWPPSSTPIPINVSVKDNYGNVVASGNYTTAGTYNLSFTPASAGANYTLEFHMTKASAFCFFRVDDVLVSYDDTTTMTVCKEVEDGYRYGFNGQEKDNQVSGNGNSYSAEFWQYSSRLGKRWNLDPRPNVSISPYATFGNNPILFSDVKGDTITDPKSRAHFDNLVSQTKEKIQEYNRKLKDIAFSTDMSSSEKQKEYAHYSFAKGEMENALLEYDEMLHTQDFNYNISVDQNISKEANGETILAEDGYNINIKFRGNSATLSHEMKHGYDYISGNLDGSSLTYDLNDEVAAHTRAMAFDRNHYSGVKYSSFGVVKMLIISKINS